MLAGHLLMVNTSPLFISKPTKKGLETKSCLFTGRRTSRQSFPHHTYETSSSVNAVLVLLNVKSGWTKATKGVVLQCYE